MFYLDLSQVNIIHIILNIFLVTTWPLQVYSMTTTASADEIKPVSSISSSSSSSSSPVVTLPSLATGNFSSSSSDSPSTTISSSSSITSTPSPPIITTTTDPNQQTWSQSYFINQGVRPWSYGYNTGIHPYTVTYNYPMTSTVVYPNMNNNGGGVSNRNPFFRSPPSGQSPNQGQSGIDSFPGFTSEDMKGLPLNDRDDLVGSTFAVKNGANVNANNNGAGAGGVKLNPTVNNGRGEVSKINNNDELASLLSENNPLTGNDDAFPVNQVMSGDGQANDFNGLDDNSVQNDPLPFNL